MKKNTYILCGTALVALASAPTSVSAQLRMTADTFGLSPSTNVSGSFILIISFLTGLIGLLSMLMIVAGGVMYMTSRGDSDNIERAKKWVIYAIVGLVVSLLAYTLVTAISNGLLAG